ncbi:MAG: hypothetical protein A2Y34_08805 [Spirochaetes bacterium GWC1_27_15]|nr:MAG: hypothetical protein A2Y34_08805 [Spirochaetes bacterium GWC1_27_15]
MKGIHVNWTKPFFDKNGKDKKYFMFDIDILTQIASVLFWKKNNGEIILYTDTPGLDYYKSIGFDVIYDEINVSILDEYNKIIQDAHLAPCLGRMYVLSKLIPPFVSMDYDLVSFDKIPESFFDIDIRFFHWEIPDNSTYPLLEKQYKPKDFVFEKDWDQFMMIPNIAILYIKNNKIWPEFPEKAIDYIQKCLRDKCNISHSSLAIFADQRMLGMMAKKNELSIDSFINKIWICSSQRNHNRNIFSDGAIPHWVTEVPMNFGMFAYDDIPNNKHKTNSLKNELLFYHTWIGKSFYLNEDGKEEREKYCTNLLEKTLDSFPYIEEMLMNSNDIEIIKNYELLKNKSFCTTKGS